MDLPETPYPEYFHFEFGFIKTDASLDNKNVHVLENKFFIPNWIYRLFDDVGGKLVFTSVSYKHNVGVTGAITIFCCQFDTSDDLNLQLHELQRFLFYSRLRSTKTQSTGADITKFVFLTAPNSAR